jgi:hypothetical protein
VCATCVFSCMCLRWVCACVCVRARVLRYVYGRLGAIARVEVLFPQPAATTRRTLTDAAPDLSLRVVGRRQSVIHSALGEWQPGACCFTGFQPHPGEGCAARARLWSFYTRHFLFGFRVFLYRLHITTVRPRTRLWSVSARPSRYFLFGSRVFLYRLHITRVRLGLVCTFCSDTMPL